MPNYLSYDDGGPAFDVNPNLWEWLSAAVASAKDEPAVISVRQDTSHLESLVPASRKQPTQFAWTYNELSKAVDKIAHYFVDQGISHGDCLVVYFQGCADWALFYWVSARLGTRFTSLDPASLDDPKLTKHFLSSLEPKAVVVQNGKLAEKFDSHRGLVSTRQAAKLISAPAKSSQTVPSWTFLADVESANGPVPPPPTKDINHVSQIVYTSGSTNLPKGCLLTNQVIESQITQLSHLDLGWSGFTRFVFTTSPFMVIGYLGSLSTWRQGGCVVFPKIDWLDRKAIIEDIIGTETTHVWNLPSKVNLLASTVKDHADLVPRSLQYALSSGEVSHSSTRKHIKEVLGVKHVTSHWGMTEGCPGIGIPGTTPIDKWPVATPAEIATIGKALPGTAVKIANGTNQPVARGEYGELQICCSAFIDGYLDGRSADSFYNDEEGRKWFKTGDQSLMDNEGYVYLLGRLGEQIQTRDTIVVPSIVDEVVKGAFGIDSLVFTVGVPDSTKDREKLIITVLPKPQEDIDAEVEGISQTLRDELGSESVPKLFVSLDRLDAGGTWPLTPSGKVKRSAVEDMVLDLLGRSEIPR